MAINTLLDAGVKVWMITGDKQVGGRAGARAVPGTDGGADWGPGLWAQQLVGGRAGSSPSPCSRHGQQHPLRGAHWPSTHPRART